MRIELTKRINYYSIILHRNYNTYSLAAIQLSKIEEGKVIRLES
jgi:hypothetical protein